MECFNLFHSTLLEGLAAREFVHPAPSRKKKKKGKGKRKKREYVSDCNLVNYPLGWKYSNRISYEVVECELSRLPIFFVLLHVSLNTIWCLRLAVEHAAV